MLTKENSCGFTPYPRYPVYEYHSRSGWRPRIMNGGKQIKTKPRGYNEIISYHNADEEFADYLKWLEDEHKGITNEKLLEGPNCPMGQWRNEMWMDEIKRRGLIEKEGK